MSRKSHRAYHLTTIILTISMGVLFVVASFFLLTNYVSTQQIIKHEVSKSLNYRNHIAERAILAMLADLDEAVTLVVNQVTLNRESVRSNDEQMASMFELFSLSTEGSQLDLLALVDSGQKIQNDLSFSLSPKGRKLLQSYNQNRQVEGMWQLVVDANNGGLHAALLNSNAIIDAEYGQVIAYVVYGISLNDNASLTNKIRDSAAVDRIELLVNEWVIASSFSPDTVGGNGDFLVGISALDFQANSWQIYIRSQMRDTISEMIDSSYRDDALILVLFTAMAALVLLVLMRGVTSRGFGRLICYSDTIREDQEVPPFLPGSITEFNQLGRSLEQMMCSVQQSGRALQDSETHLHTLVNTLPDLIWLKDPNGIYLTCNLRFERFIGVKEAELIGKSDYDFVDKELTDLFRQNDKAAIAAGGPRMNEEEVTFADDGHTELLETVKTPMFSADGTLIGVLGIGRDITERRQSEEALRRSQKMDAIGQLTGGIAHDFNNILAIIIGNMELLELQIDDKEKLLERIGTIRKAGQRATDLTKQLLSFSRGQATETSTTNINHVIMDMEELMVRSVTPQIEMSYQLAETLWSAEIEAGNFEDALLNLVINARDAMGGHGHITVETCNTTLDAAYCAHNVGVEEGDYVELMVSDNGTGISQADQERIFEPFFTTKEEGKGTGLGLAMVFGFVKRSGGHIKCYSELGVGTTFHLYLPKGAEETLQYDRQEGEKEVLLRGTEKILIVDDEPSLVELAHISLSELGYQIATANNARQALECLTTDSEIALLFSDVVMPGDINGYELADQVIQLYPQIKVLLTSGYTGKAMTQNGQPRFSADLLNKPYTQLELSQRIREILDR